MACVYPPGCLQNITITDPTSVESGLLEISLIPTRGVTDINIFSQEGVLHMKEMLDASDAEWDRGIQGLQKDVGLILLGVEEDDPKEYIADEEIEGALDLWRDSGMDELHEPSYFSDYVGFPEPVGSESPGFAMMKKMGWSPGEGLGEDGIVDPICKMIPSLLRDDRGKVAKFTPEMLEQREQLNWIFNFVWNTPQGPGGGRPWCNWVRAGSEDMHIPEQFGEIELVSVGENHGVAKSPMGSVFVPRGVLNYLGSKAQVGQEFSASLEFVEGARYPWRVVKNSVEHIN